MPDAAAGTASDGPVVAAPDAEAVALGVSFSLFSCVAASFMLLNAAPDHV